MFLTISYPTAWTEEMHLCGDKVDPTFCEKAAKAFSMEVEVE